MRAVSEGLRRACGESGFHAWLAKAWVLRARQDALIALRQIELTPPPRGDEPFTDGFHHSFYLATHIVYVQSAYNAIKADQREIPWLYRYVRASFRFWMRQVREQRTQRLWRADRLLRSDGT